MILIRFRVELCFEVAFRWSQLQLIDDRHGLMLASGGQRVL